MLNGDLLICDCVNKTLIFQRNSLGMFTLHLGKFTFGICLTNSPGSSLYCFIITLNFGLKGMHFAGNVNYKMPVSNNYAKT